MDRKKIEDYYYKNYGYEASMVIQHFNELIIDTQIAILTDIIDEIEDEVTIKYIEEKIEKLEIKDKGVE
jgi:hypothetical protein